MDARKMVDGMLGNCLSSLHAKLAEAVKAAVGGALRGGHLSLSQLARSVDSATSMRHRVKRMGRLLGNVPLQGARAEIYQEISTRWLAGVDNVLVVIDWSDATTDQRWHLLRASVAVDGRSVTLYEEIHPPTKVWKPSGASPVSGAFGTSAARRLHADHHHRCRFSLDLVRPGNRAPLAIGRTHPRQGYCQHCRRPVEAMPRGLPGGYVARTSLRRCPVCSQSPYRLPPVGWCWSSAKPKGGTVAREWASIPVPMHRSRRLVVRVSRGCWPDLRDLR